MIEHAPILIIISPLTGALILSIISKLNPSRRVKDFIALISLTIPVVLLFYYSPAILTSEIRYQLGGWTHPYGISLVLNSFSTLLAGIVGIVTLTTFVYSLESRDLLPEGKKYYFLFLFMSTGLYGVFLTGDIVNRYIFFELTVLTTYVLLTYTNKKESVLASFNYLIIGSIASFFFLTGIGLLYFYTGFLDFQALSTVVPNMSANRRNLIFSFFLIAIGIKSGLIPFHTWLPDAHVSAPTPITAVLAGITLKTGAYILIKLLNIGFDTEFIITTMIFIGMATAIIGVIISFLYWDLKRIMAWITISQMGMIIGVLSLWSVSAIGGGLFHLINHSIFKPLIFLAAGGLAYTGGSWDIRRLDLKKSNPILVGGLFIGLFSLIGLPPLNGFYSKTLIFYSASGNMIVYSSLLVVHILTAAAVFRILFRSYSRGAGKDVEKNEENYYRDDSGSTLTTSLLTPITVLAGICVFIGATSTIWLNNVITPSASILIEGGQHLMPPYFEFQALLSSNGIITISTSLLGIPIGYFLENVSIRKYLEPIKGLITNVPPTQAVRYIILVMAIFLALLIL